MSIEEDLQQIYGAMDSSYNAGTEDLKAFDKVKALLADKVIAENALKENDAMRRALIKIYDSPSNTDTIIDIAYDALNGEV
jgi:hypothetical protein